MREGSSPPRRLQNGLPPHICQLILGHKNLNTTMDYNNSRELHQAGEIREVCPGIKECNVVPTVQRRSFVTWVGNEPA